MASQGKVLQRPSQDNLNTIMSSSSLDDDLLFIAKSYVATSPLLTHDNLMPHFLKTSDIISYIKIITVVNSI